MNDRDLVIFLVNRLDFVEYELTESELAIDVIESSELDFS